MRRHFDVTAPSVHQMVMTSEKAGLISRRPEAAQSIQLLVAPEALPILRCMRRRVRICMSRTGGQNLIEARSTAYFVSSGAR
jgi:hypothetical protein